MAGWTFGGPVFGDWKNSVRMGTLVALPANTASNGGRRLTADANGAIPAIDGIAPALTNRVLAKNEAGAAEPNNGIYSITQLGNAGAPWILDRVPDAATATDFTARLTVAIEEGTQAGQIWTCTNTGAIVIGTTAITFGSPSFANLLLGPFRQIATVVVFAQSPYTVLATDAVIDGNTVGGNINLLLPAATGSGRWLPIKKITDDVNTLSATPNGADTIDGVAAAVVLANPRAALWLHDAAAARWDIY